MLGHMGNDAENRTRVVGVRPKRREGEEPIAGRLGAIDDGPPLHYRRRQPVSDSLRPFIGAQEQAVG